MSDLVLTLNNGIKRIRSAAAGEVARSFISMRTEAIFAIPDNGAFQVAATPRIQSLRVPVEDPPMEPTPTGIRILRAGLYLAIIDFVWGAADATEQVTVGGSGFSPPFSAVQQFDSSLALGQFGSYSQPFSAPFSTLVVPGAEQPVPFEVNALARQQAGGPVAFGALFSVMEI